MYCKTIGCLYYLFIAQVLQRMCSTVKNTQEVNALSSAGDHPPLFIAVRSTTPALTRIVMSPDRKQTISLDLGPEEYECRVLFVICMIAVMSYMQML